MRPPTRPTLLPSQAAGEPPPIGSAQKKAEEDSGGLPEYAGSKWASLVIGAAFSIVSALCISVEERAVAPAAGKAVARDDAISRNYRKDLIIVPSKRADMVHAKYHAMLQVAHAETEKAIQNTVLFMHWSASSARSMLDQRTARVLQCWTACTLAAESVPTVPEPHAVDLTRTRNCLSRASSPARRDATNASTQYSAHASTFGKDSARTGVYNKHILWAFHSSAALDLIEAGLVRIALGHYTTRSQKLYTRANVADCVRMRLMTEGSAEVLHKLMGSVLREGIGPLRTVRESTAEAGITLAALSAFFQYLSLGHDSGPFTSMFVGAPAADSAIATEAVPIEQGAEPPAKKRRKTSTTAEPEAPAVLSDKQLRAIIRASAVFVSTPHPKSCILAASRFRVLLPNGDVGGGTAF